MSLVQIQAEFTSLIPSLLEKAWELGYHVTLGDAYRDPRVHGALGEKLGYGHRSSAHKQRLAIDLNLFKELNGDGSFIFMSSTEAHRELGEWWEKQHTLARWGGRFSDGNHYSFEYGGVK